MSNNASQKSLPASLSLTPKWNISSVPIFRRPASAQRHYLNTEVTKALASAPPSPDTISSSLPMTLTYDSPSKATSDTKKVTPARGLSKPMTMREKELMDEVKRQERAKRTTGRSPQDFSLAASRRSNSPSRLPPASPADLKVNTGFGVSVSNPASPARLASPARPASPALSYSRSKSPREAGHIPGFTGHVPGYAHVAGRTFGKATLRAMTRDPVSHMLGESIPSPPHANPKIPTVDTFAGHIPGYAGHVREYIHKCGGTYGSLTSHLNVHEHGGLVSKVGRKTLTAKALHFTPIPNKTGQL